MLGATLGMLKALCVLAVLLNYVEMIDKNEQVLKADLKAGSILYKPVHNTGNTLTASLKQFIADNKDRWEETLKETHNS